jgi:hypothetical protein
MIANPTETDEIGFNTARKLFAQFWLKFYCQWDLRYNISKVRYESDRNRTQGNVERDRVQKLWISP